MENYVSLMILLIVFMSLMLLVAYVADAFACWFVKWLGQEDVENEYEGTSSIRCSNQDRMVEGDLFKSIKYV